jgi:hypothetical protein
MVVWMLYCVRVLWPRQTLRVRVPRPAVRAPTYNPPVPLAYQRPACPLRPACPSCQGSLHGPQYAYDGGLKMPRGPQNATARPLVCRALGQPSTAEEAITTLRQQLDQTYRTVAARLPYNPAVRIETRRGKERLVLSPWRNWKSRPAWWRSGQRWRPGSPAGRVPPGCG